MLFTDYLQLLFLVCWTSGLWLALGLALVLLAQQTNRGHSLDEEQHKLDKRRLRGGVVWNDLLWDLIGETQRTIAKLSGKLVAADDEKERMELAQLLEGQQRNLDRLYRMMSMKEPNHD